MYLGHHVGHELLPSEAWLHCHNEHHVYIIDERKHLFNWGAGLYPNTNLTGRQSTEQS